MSRPRLFALLFGATSLVPIASARAQDLLLDLPGSLPGRGEFGVGIQDWDGDGVVDLAIGMPGDSTIAPGAGSVCICSGVDGTVLTTLASSNAGDGFGVVAPMPDLDGDGFDDLAVGATFASYVGKQTGSIFLYAGRSGALLRRIDGANDHHMIGYPLGSVGDVDGDGIADLFAGEAGAAFDVVHVFSGADGHEIHAIPGNTGELFGYTVNAIDDLDGDGVRELLVGAPYHQDASKQQVGAVYVISTATATTLRTLTGVAGHESIGFASGDLSDADGDGIRDYGVVVYETTTGHENLTLHSGASGAVVATLRAPAGYEIDAGVVDPGDLNGDGVHDIAIAGFGFDAAHSYHGMVFVVSGSTLLHLDRIELDAEIPLSPPFSTSTFDVDGDGRSELIVNSFANGGVGHVRVYAGDDLWQNATPTDPVAGATLELATREGAPGSLTALVLEDVDGTPTFAVIDVLARFDSTGGRTLTCTIPAGFAGHDFTLRAYANDSAGRLIRSASQLVHLK